MTDIWTIIIFAILVFLAGATLGLVLFAGIEGYFRNKVPFVVMTWTESLLGLSGGVMAVWWFLFAVLMENSI